MTQATKEPRALADPHLIASYSSAPASEPSPAILSSGSVSDRRMNARISVSIPYSGARLWGEQLRDPDADGHRFHDPQHIGHPEMNQ